MQIHYFQRYHSKENVDTSNTMLMLSRLYNYNADKFFSMLNSLILGEDESPEITFDLQVVGDDSVPDAVISQKSFKIVVETKLYNQFYKQQLVNHLEQFGAEDIKVLLTLDPKPMKPQLFDELAVELKKYNSENATRLIHPIKHVNLTFEQLVAAMADIVDDRDTEIIAVLDDFKKYCFDEKLIPDGYKWMRAIVAGTTFQDNMDLDLFYDQESRKFSEHGYIGLYKDKSIRAIGKLKKTIIAVENNGSMTYRAESGANLPQMRLNASTRQSGVQIIMAITLGRLAIDILSLKSSTRWTLEKAVRTRFKKASSSILPICSDIKQCLTPMKSQMI